MIQLKKTIDCARLSHRSVVLSIWLLAVLLSPSPLIKRAHGEPDFAPRQFRQPGIGRRNNSQPHPSVCRIVVPEGDGAYSYGSGTLVAIRDEYGLVLTNWHVVRDASDVVTVIFPDRFQSGARVIRSDQDWDLAALVVWRPKASPVPIATSPPQPGDSLTIAGYGSGTYRAATGRCTQYVSPAADLPVEMIEISVEARQGDSGGPMFNDRGELAGVLFGAGSGVTVGSYAGRVGTFLASISPELARPSPSTIVNAEPQLSDVVHPEEPEVENTGTLASVAPIPDQRENEFRERMSSETGLPGQPLTITWREVVGKSPFDMVKSLLAVFGCAAVLVRLLRWFG